MTNSFLVITSLLVAIATSADILVQRRVQGDQITVLKAISIPGKSKDIRMLTDIPEFISEGQGQLGSSRYQELIYPNALPPHPTKKLLDQYLEKASWPGSEVRTLVLQGQAANRIDITILGDGYQESEKEKFFQDAKRITDDLFAERTYSSYLALFNVYAVFVPSKDSGITDTVQRKTAFGLYRSPANSKRAIMPGNTTQIERALALAPATADYPIILANDDFYGGLGGRYAITTRSVRSGSVVLRHELGHNFGAVGEEYDGGQVYSGANFSASSNVPWQHWLAGKLQVFVSQHLSGDYVWQNLKNNPYNAKFSFPTGDYIFEALLSSVGWASDRDVRVSIDGKNIDIVGEYTTDRSFYSLQENFHVSPGAHQIRIEDNNGDGDNILAFSVLYAHPSQIIKDRGFVGAYSVFDDSDSKRGYRPTFNGCLMRDMLYKDLCAVDKENIWIRFLERMSLIDEIEIQSDGQGSKVTAKSPALALNYTLVQIQSGKEQIISSGPKNQWTFSPKQKGNYKVYAEFVTPEVRKPGTRFVSSKIFSL